jgi:hypothetical protein
LEIVNGVEPVFILARAEGMKPAGSNVFDTMWICNKMVTAVGIATVM